ncbi:DUF2283 domain-containing protein [bacterium]|nr:DUF2283 domain-containing protein [bacterium]
MQKIKYSSDVDALMVEISERPIDHAEQTGQFITHFGEDGDVVLIEILNAQKFLLQSISSVMKQAETAKEPGSDKRMKE